MTQDTSLLHRTIRDNIRYGKPDATEAEIVAAAKQAQAHDFILELEDWRGRRGYDAHVGERGVKLSGGQRQRIAIARVILKNAPILVLDEATSSLDSEVEAAIQASLDTLMAGKTVIAIAHRLSTIARMDRLVVLDRGRIVEQGTHAELLRTGGHYAELWRRQSGGFINSAPPARRRNSAMRTRQDDLIGGGAAAMAADRIDAARAAQMVDQSQRIVRLGIGAPGDMPVGPHQHEPSWRRAPPTRHRRCRARQAAYRVASPPRPDRPPPRSCRTGSGHSPRPARHRASGRRAARNAARGSPAPTTTRTCPSNRPDAPRRRRR